MTILKILAKPKYLAVATIVFLVVLVFAAWLPNLNLVANAIASSSMTLWQKATFLTSLVGSLQTNFTLLSRTVTIINAALMGVQASLLVYYLRQAARVQQSMGMSAVGVVTSMLGIGCASCGSVVLTSLIGFSSTTAILAILPFHGQEFGFIGIAILLLANYMTIKKINAPMVCVVREVSS